MAGTEAMEPLSKLAKLEVPLSNGSGIAPKLLVKKLSSPLLADLPLLQAMISPAPRSGLAWKHSIDVGAGVIDADYRGPVGVILFNFSDHDFTVKAGDRIAQLILERIVTPEVLEVDDLECTVRGEGGFGSTGIATVLPSS